MVTLSAGITVLLSLTVFMLLVAEIMPATSDSVPLIGEPPAPASSLHPAQLTLISWTHSPAVLEGRSQTSLEV